MKKLNKLLSSPWAAYTCATCSAVLLYIILCHFSVIAGWLSALWKLLSPVVIGIIVAYLLNPVSDFFEFKMLGKVRNRNAAHFWSVVITVLCFVLFLTVLLVALIPSLYQSISKLIGNWDNYTSKLQEILEKIVAFAQSKNINIDISNVSTLIDNGMDTLVNWLKNNVKTVLSTLGTVGSSVSNFAIGVLFGVCFLVAEKSLVGLLSKIRRALFKKDRLERNNKLWERCHAVFIRYIGCTLLDACIVAVCSLVFALVMRMPYAGLIAAVVGITNIIPTFGPMIGALIAMFFLVLDKPLNALWFFIFICILQGLDGMVIKPRLFKGSLGIPAVWTLVLIILGGKIAGMLGILLAIPIAAILVILYHETIEPRLNHRIAKMNGQTTKDPGISDYEEEAQDASLTTDDTEE